METIICSRALGSNDHWLSFPDCLFSFTSFPPLCLPFYLSLSFSYPTFLSIALFSGPSNFLWFTCFLTSIPPLSLPLFCLLQKRPDQMVEGKYEEWALWEIAELSLILNPQFSLTYMRFFLSVPLGFFLWFSLFVRLIYKSFCMSVNLHYWALNTCVAVQVIVEFPIHWRLKIIFFFFLDPSFPDG